MTVDGPGARHGRAAYRRNATPGAPGTADDGEGRTRTGDTPVFSRVLYQLSYLAAAGQCSVAGEPASAESDGGPGAPAATEAAR